MAKMEIKLDSLKEHIDITIQHTVEDVKQNFIDKMREEIAKLQTYELLDGGVKYVERDDVLKIFDEYASEIGGKNENGD